MKRTYRVTAHDSTPKNSLRKGDIVLADLDEPKAERDTDSPGYVGSVHATVLDDRSTRQWIQPEFLVEVVAEYIDVEVMQDGNSYFIVGIDENMDDHWDFRTVEVDSKGNTDLHALWSNSFDCTEPYTIAGRSSYQRNYVQLQS